MCGWRSFRRWYGRHIHRLDQIPDEELELLRDRGINGLWLIGLWERSTASQDDQAVDAGSRMRWRRRTR
jgi:hypothetical protein